MKLILSSLLITCAFLTACSDSGSKNKNNPGLYTFSKDFQPSHKPPNAAPMSYLKDVMISIKDSNLYIPSDAAFFNVIADGSDLKQIWDGSPERQEAFKKLNSEGLRFVNEIRTTCTINDARKTESGDVRQGATKTQSINMSTSGNTCPFLVSKTDSNATTYDLIKLDQTAESVQIVMRIEGTNSESREVRSQRVSDLSGLRSFAINLRFNGNVDVIQTETTQTMKMRIEGSGSLMLVLSNGDTVRGPLSMEAVGTEKGMESRFLFEGQSNQGVIRVVVITKANQAPEIYLNGEKLDAGAFGAIPF
nr:hypothetical protein [uncultured Bdellovibrio sp.]